MKRYFILLLLVFALHSTAKSEDLYLYYYSKLSNLLVNTGEIVLKKLAYIDTINAIYSSTKYGSDIKMNLITIWIDNNHEIIFRHYDEYKSFSEGLKEFSEYLFETNKNKYYVISSLEMCLLFNFKMLIMKEFDKDAYKSILSEFNAYHDTHSYYKKLVK